MGPLDYIADQQRRAAAALPTAGRDNILAGLRATGPGTGAIGGPLGNGTFPPGAVAAVARADAATRPAVLVARPTAPRTPRERTPKPIRDVFGRTWVRE